MKHLRLSAALIFVVHLAAAPALAADTQAPSTVEDDRVMVQLADGSWEARPKRDEAPSGLLDPAQPSDVVAVEPMFVYRQFGSSTLPNDPTFPSQWHLQRNQSWRGWRFGDGSGVTVAVVDSGVGATSDLACHDYVSPFDFRTGAAAIPPDLNGHGTFVTAVLAECSRNGHAGAGTAPGVSIMPLGVLDSQGVADTILVYQALYWALDHGADIVNVSLGFSCLQPYPACRDVPLDQAIRDLAAAGVMIVAAAGNDGTGFVSFPANHPDVVAVGASGYDSQRAEYSTYGAGLDMVAPTGDSNDPAGRRGVTHQGLNGFSAGMGTSFSAPQVSGALAILRSAGFSSGSLAATAIYQSARDIAPNGYDTVTGHGDLRIRQALAWGGAGVTPPIEDAVYHTVGDFTGDGAADAVTYDGRYGRWWVLGSQGNGFAPDQWARFSTVGGWSSRLSGDFTGDGREDVANYHPSNGTWWVSRSTGSSFSTGVWADFVTAGGWGTRLVGDFNGDGRDDIANYHPSNGTWWVSRSTGSSFSTGLWADFVSTTGWKTHLVGDFNGDGRDDIASYNTSNGTWWVSRSTGSSFSLGLWADFATAGGWTTQAVGDFNNDNRDDIANFNSSNGTWWVSRSVGSTFSTGLWADFATAGGWGSQLVGDFTGDGRADIANYHNSNGTWWVSRSTGSSLSTTLWADYATLTGWTNRFVGDFDADGRDDVANHHQDGIWVVSRSTGNQFGVATWHD